MDGQANLVEGEEMYSMKSLLVKLFNVPSLCHDAILHLKYVKSTSFDVTFSMLLRANHTREFFNYLPQELRSKSSQLHHSSREFHSIGLC